MLIEFGSAQSRQAKGNYLLLTVLLEPAIFFSFCGQPSISNIKLKKKAIVYILSVRLFILTRRDCRQLSLLTG